MTAGTEFAKMVRKNFGIGARTRTYRGGMNLKNEILEAIANSNNYPGYYSEAKSTIFRTAYPILNAIIKHVKGGRIDGMIAYQIEMMSPWQYAGFIGDMIDAGITNNGEAEIYFQNMRKMALAA